METMRIIYAYLYYSEGQFILVADFRGLRATATFDLSSLISPLIRVRHYQDTRIAVFVRL